MLASPKPPIRHDPDLCAGAPVELGTLAGDLDAVLDTAVDGVIIIDEGGVIQRFNPACVRIFGYELAEVIGRNVKMLMPAGFAREHDQYLRNYRQTGEAQIIGIGREVVGRRKDGSEFPMDLSVGAMATQGGRGYVGIIRDITDKKAAAEALEAYAEKLKRSNAELEQFAYVAAHDLQEPLRMISSYCDLLQRRYGDRLDAAGHDFVEFAVDGAKRMRGLIDDLLTYSRVGREETEAADVDCNAVLRSVAGALSRVVEEARAEIVWHDLPTVDGHAGQLEQLFQNLIANSLKFRSDDPPRIEIESAARGGFWHFAVSDNGIGIDPRFTDKVFLMFQRLHGKQKYSGSGIGLALCKKIVEQHGGTIWVDSDYAAGARIRFTLRRNQ